MSHRSFCRIATMALLSCGFGHASAQVVLPSNEYDPYEALTNNALFADTLHAPFGLKVGTLDSFRFTFVGGDALAAGTLTERKGGTRLIETVFNPEGSIVYDVFVPDVSGRRGASRDTATLVIDASSQGLYIAQTFYRHFQDELIDTLVAEVLVDAERISYEFISYYDALGRRDSILGFELTANGARVAGIQQYYYEYAPSGRLARQTLAIEGGPDIELGVIPSTTPTYTLAQDGRLLQVTRLHIGPAGELDSLAITDADGAALGMIFRVDDGSDPLLRRYIYALDAETQVELAYYYRRLFSGAAEALPLIGTELRFANPAARGSEVEVVATPADSRYRLYNTHGQLLASGPALRGDRIALPDDLSNGLNLLVLDAPGFESRAWQLIVR